MPPFTLPTWNEDTGQLEDVEYFSTEEVAARLHVSTRTVLARIRAGRWHALPWSGRWWMTEQDIGAAVQAERDRARLRFERPAPVRQPDHEEPQRPRLGLAIADEDADKIEDIR